MSGRRQYPSVASNLLKMYVDVELFLVTLVGLILRIENDDLGNDPLPLGLRSLFPDSCGWLCTGTLYGDLLWILLLLTLVPIFVSVRYRSPEERAQALLHKMARLDADDDATSDLAQRRAELRTRSSSSRRGSRRQRRRGEVQEQANPVHGSARATFESEAADGDDGAGVGLQAAQADAGGLPAGWVRKEHNGRSYYVNASTGAKSWTRPSATAATAAAVPAAAAEPGLPAGWVQKEHNGRPYFVNTSTGVKTWTRPTEAAAAGENRGRTRGVGKNYNALERLNGGSR